MSIPVISRTNLPPLSESVVQSCVRSAFEQLAHGQAAQPAQTVTDLPGGGDVIAYQAALEDVYAVKVSPYLPRPDKAIVTAWTLLLSTETGEPLLLVDAGTLTAERTAATTALAIDALAPADASRLAVIGLGPLGLAHLRHARAVRDFTDITVFAPNAHALDEVRLAPSADSAAQGADVVMLCTSAAEPVIDVTALPAGTLVTSISTNAPNAHEIDPAALESLDVYADYIPAAINAAGEMRIAGFRDIRGDLPGLLTGQAPPPTGDRVVYFRSVGLGIEDAAVAVAVLKELS